MGHLQGDLIAPPLDK